jgi:hypothetical protein
MKNDTQVKKFKDLCKMTAQSLLEYILIVGIASLIFVAIGPMMKRGIQSIVKVTADQLSPQNEAQQQPKITDGYLVESFSTIKLNSETTTLEAPNRIITYLFDDTTETNQESLINLGFTNRSSE